MTVKQLIAELQKLPPEMPVCVKEHDMAEDGYFYNSGVRPTLVKDIYENGDFNLSGEFVLIS